ncbi:MAG TPA: DUF3175 domain-containing protein [Vicinamibacterales bacterium]
MTNARRTRAKRWSQRVTERSHALDLEPGVFTWRDPRRIAESLKRSALQSTRRKGTPYQSAMSMLTFYINRAGRQLTPARRAVLDKAKGELRSMCERGSTTAAARPPSGQSRRQRQLIAAAFHEAGHAVAAYHLHVRLRRISIGSDEGNALGWLELWLPHVTSGEADDIRSAHVIERHIIVLLAGAQAERIGVGRASYPGGGLDFYEAMRRAESICRTSEETSAYLRWLQMRAHSLVERPTWRQPIEALATRLLERRDLSARETRAIIRGAISAIQSPSSIRRRSPARSSRRLRPRAA